MSNGHLSKSVTQAGTALASITAPPCGGGSIPRRMWVVGPCGAGKSTVARRLAAAAGVTACHLDELFWRPGWSTADALEFERAVAEVVARPAWVIDGNYNVIRERFLHAADLIVWLDLPLRVTVPRLLLRCVHRAWSREPVCNGNRESLLRSLTHRDSILWWALRSDHRRRVELRRELRGQPHVRLRTRAEIDRWVVSTASIHRPDAG